jgi:CopG family transcriptional regulator, nickel-responsive regulator
MRRLTISVDESLASQFDSFMKRKGYQNRSEAFRDLVRSELQKEHLEKGVTAYCVASLSYVYNHHERQLAARVATLQHQHHDITVAATHVHLDHSTCIETVILRGRTAEVAEFAESIIAQTGVRHGKFNLIPVKIAKSTHKNHKHLHFHPTS